MSSGYLGSTGTSGTISYIAPSSVNYVIVNDTTFTMTSTTGTANITTKVEVLGPGQTYTRTGTYVLVGGFPCTGWTASVIEIVKGTDSSIGPIRSNFDIFLNSGTWVCPANVSVIYITGSAGGGGGNGGLSYDGTYGSGGGSGGATTFGSLLTLGGGAGGFSTSGGAGGAGKPGIINKFNGGDGGTGALGGVTKKGNIGIAGIFDSMLNTNIVGNGGIGGLGFNSGNSIASGGGGGGGGGCHYQKFTVTPGQSYTVTIGAGGIAGNAGTNASAGSAGEKGMLYVEW